MIIIKKMKTSFWRGFVFNLGGFAIIWNDESPLNHAVVDAIEFAPPQIIRARKRIIQFAWVHVRRKLP